MTDTKKTRTSEKQDELTYEALEDRFAPKITTFPKGGTGFRMLVDAD